MIIRDKLYMVKYELIDHFRSPIYEGYNINFPLENKLTILEGEDYDCNELIIDIVKNYLINTNENVLYFETDRKLIINKDQILAHDMMFKLTHKISPRQIIEQRYDIQDPFAYETIEVGAKITCGYLQLMNFFYGILNYPGNDLNVIISNVHLQLHTLIIPNFVMDLMNMKKIKRIIVTNLRENCFGIKFKQCQYKTDQILIKA